MTDWLKYGANVAQAAGMVSVQADCTPDEALRLMQERVLLIPGSLESLSLAVINRQMRFGAGSSA